MEVDSFKYLPGLVSRYYKLAQVESVFPIPWTPVEKPLDQCRFGLVTTGGLYQPTLERPFDSDRERREPTWGDPSFRTLPVNMDLSKAQVSHLHLNTCLLEEDLNVLLPIDRFRELAQSGVVLDQASHAYSFMGYQGFPADLSCWCEESGPAVAGKLLAEEVDAVLLTAA